MESETTGVVIPVDPEPAFKALRVIYAGEKREARVSYSVHGQAQVTYVKDQWSTPPPWLDVQGFPLLVFGSLEETRAFVEQFFNSNYEIWQVRTIHRRPLSGVNYCASGDLALGYTDPFYPDNPERGWPDGTLAADAVQLVCRIDWDGEPIRELSHAR